MQCMQEPWASDGLSPDCFKSQKFSETSSSLEAAARCHPVVVKAQSPGRVSGMLWTQTDS